MMMKLKLLTHVGKMKKRSVLENNKYIVVYYNNNMIKLKNSKNGKIEYKKRIAIQILN